MGTAKKLRADFNEPVIKIQGDKLREFDMAQEEIFRMRTPSLPIPVFKVSVSLGAKLLKVQRTGLNRYIFGEYKFET